MGCGHLASALLYRCMSLGFFSTTASWWTVWRSLLPVGQLKFSSSREVSSLSDLRRRTATTQWMWWWRASLLNIESGKTVFKSLFQPTSFVMGCSHLASALLLLLYTLLQVSCICSVQSFSSKLWKGRWSWQNYVILEWNWLCRQWGLEEQWWHEQGLLCALPPLQVCSVVSV